MDDFAEFNIILEKSGVMATAGKKRAHERNAARNRHVGKLTRGANVIIEQLACKDRPEDNKEGYKAKMRELRDRRKRGQF